MALPDTGLSWEDDVRRARHGRPARLDAMAPGSGRSGSPNHAFLTENIRSTEENPAKNDRLVSAERGFSG
jgi:hypothetical protein